MKQAALYGLQRGLVQAALFIGCLYLIKSAFWVGAWLALQRHGGGDIWLNM